MILLLYASPEEVEYIDYKPKFCIGVGAKKIPPINNNYKVVLFGSCGLLKPNIELDEFIVPARWFNSYGNSVDTSYMSTSRMGSGLTLPYSVNKRWLRSYVREQYPECVCVDQESYIVGEYCQERNIPFVSVRYVIDKCGQRLAPVGINHFYRKFQHRRMQRKFNELIKSL